MSEELFIMSAKEISRLEVIQQVKNGVMRQSQAAELLGISVRQLIRLKKR